MWVTSRDGTMFRSASRELRMASQAGSLDFRGGIDEAATVRQRPAMVGRSGELAQLERLWQRSVDGTGSLAMLIGEAGIGKSRLAEELAARASAGGAVVVWGRCWEAGSAPAFWPWRQALTSLSRATAESAVWRQSEVLSRFMPSGFGASEAPPSLSGIEPEHARFMLMEEVAATLSKLAASTPLLVILEDLHVADGASLLLLDFLEPHLRHEPIVVLATYRPSELGRHGAELLRVAQRAEVISLEPLDAAATAEYLTSRLRTPLAADTLSEVVRATEGNPLFLDQVSQVLARDPAAPRAQLLTQGIQNIIAERLALNAPEDLQLLRTATVLGREFSVPDLVLLSEQEELDVEGALERLMLGATLERVGRETYRFSHILIHEVLYHQLAGGHVRELHRARAAQLAHWCERGESHLWAEVAHHYLAANALEEATLALERAARLALDQLALDDAVELVERALSGLPAQVDTRRRVELLLLLGHARLRAGYVEAGRDACYEAARIAKQIDSPELLARAALCAGSVYVFAKVDKRLVAWLQDAYDALPPDAPGLRAEVAARLAAALQPSITPEVPFQLAREAIALARTQNDKGLLLRVLGSAISALMDMGPARERLALNLEHEALATELNLTSDLWRARCRLVFDHFELGQMDEASDAVSSVVALAERLDHPYYLWRGIMMRAMAATFRGQLSEAASLYQQAEVHGLRARDPNWRRASTMSRVVWYRTRGELVPAELLQSVATQFDGEVFGQLALMREWVRTGHLERLENGIGIEALETGLTSCDTTLLQDLGYIAIALGDQTVIERVYREALNHADRFVSGGMTSLTWEPPLHHVLSLMASALSQPLKAIEHAERALEMVERAGSRVHAAWIQMDLAEALLGGAVPVDSDRVERLLDAAEESARLFALEPALQRHLILRRRLSDLDGASAMPVARAARALSAVERVAITLVPDGEVWCLTFGEETLRLSNTKGVRLLARLVAEPGREFHVLDLEFAGVSVDTGSAGEALDERARHEYEARIVDLKERLEEASNWNDAERASRLSDELEMVKSELGRAFGLGGRARPQGSAVERARVNVQRRLKDAVKRVRQVSARAARHLERSVRTGTYCSYQP